MVVILFILGVCLGSFYLVVGTRLPNGLNVINDRSKCDNCGHILKWYDLIPIFSYLFLGGRCHYCHQKISVLNILIEFTMGFIFVFSYLYFNVSYEMFLFLIISSIMIIIFISDFTYYIILDSPLIIGSILIILLKLYYFGISETLFHVVSGIVLFACMYLIKIFGDKLFKKESLGGGDIKFAFVMGLTLGIRLGLCSLILSAFLALPYSFASLIINKNNEVPYGPFLASSLFIIVIFYDKFLNLVTLFF